MQHLNSIVASVVPHNLVDRGPVICAYSTSNVCANQIKCFKAIRNTKALLNQLRCAAGDARFISKEDLILSLEDSPLSDIAREALVRVAPES